MGLLATYLLPINPSLTLYLKGLDSVLVGCELGAKEYCIWNPVTKMAVVSRAFVFCEKMFFPCGPTTTNHCGLILS